VFAFGLSALRWFSLSGQHAPEDLPGNVPADLPPQGMDPGDLVHPLGPEPPVVLPPAGTGPKKTAACGDRDLPCDCCCCEFGDCPGLDCPGCDCGGCDCSC